MTLIGPAFAMQLVTQLYFTDGVPAANTAFAEAQKIIDTLEQEA